MLRLEGADAGPGRYALAFFYIVSGAYKYFDAGDKPLALPSGPGGVLDEGLCVAMRRGLNVPDGPTTISALLSDICRVALVCRVVTHS
jgi:hypothetical protein